MPDVYDKEESDLSRDDAAIPHSLGDIRGDGAPKSGIGGALSGAEGNPQNPTDPWANLDAGKKPARGERALSAAKLAAGELAAAGGTGIVFVPNDPGGLGGRIKNLVRGNRGKTIGGGTVGFIIGGTVLFFSLASGPFEIIHFASLIENITLADHQNESDDRSMHLMRFIDYAKTGKFERTRMSRLGNYYADKVETKLNASGFESSYSTRFGLYDGLVLRPGEGLLADYSADDKQGIKDYVKETYGVNVVDGATTGNPKLDGKLVINNSELGFVRKYFTSRGLIKGILKGAGYSRLGSNLSMRVIAVRDNFSLHVLSSADIATQKWLDDRITRITSGANSEVRGAAEPKKTGNAATDAQAATDAEAAAASSSDSVKAATDTLAGEADGKPGVLSKFTASTTGKISIGGAAAVGLVCTLKGLVDQANTIKGQSVDKTKRIASDILTVGSQAPTGQTTLQNVGNYKKILTDSSDGTSWAGSGLIQAGLGEQVTGPGADQTLQTLNKGTPFDFLNIGALGTALSGACSSVGLGIVTAISFIGGPVSTAVLIPAAQALKPVMDDAAHWMAGKAVDVATIKGQKLGAYGIYGGHMLSDDMSVANAGNAMSSGAVAELNQGRQAAQQQDFASHNIAYKLLNPQDDRSLISQVMDKQNPNAQANIASIAQGFATFGSTLASAITKPFVSNAHAADASDAVQLPTYGFTVAEMDNPAVQNPFDNAQKVADLLDGSNGASYITRAQNCYGAAISQGSDGWDVVAGTNPIQLYGSDYQKIVSDNNCNDQSTEWLRIRFFIFDTQNMKGIACYEGGTDAGSSCSDLGLKDTSGDTNGAGPNIGQTGWPFGPGIPITIIQCFTWNVATHSGHPGLDMDGPPGTPIYAITAGTAKVTDTGGDAYGPNYVTVNPTSTTDYGSGYGHMATATVTTGQPINIGDQVGTEGSLGNSGGPHLHLNIFPGPYGTGDGPNIDPFPFLKVPSNASNAKGCH
jgi:murein DD-endopeptidase MepM/ murein hydrolase activator NlpD